jgi:type II secretory pathway pseudopilin PulG
MQRLIAALRDRRRAQAGTTMVELLVSVVIIGLALVLVIGTFSTALLNATLAKRNTAVEAVIQYEMDKITGSQFVSNAENYSECFATESQIPPAVVAYQASCGSSSYSLRADVTQTKQTANRQLWSVAVSTWPNPARVGASVSLYKVNR